MLDAAGIAGAVMTPMGAGIGGMRDAVCAGIMFRELRAFTGTSLREIVIRCRKEKTASAFKALAV